MKNRMAKICTFILTLLSVMIMTGCGEGFRRNVNKKPDDDISKAIYETVGGNKVYYQGKNSYNSDEIVIYRYLVHDYEADNVLKDMVEAANAVMEEKETTEKKELLLREEISGRYDPVVSLRTYYEGEDGYELYGSFQTLYIYGTKRSNMSDHSSYDNLSTYINLPNIKSLAVSKKIAQRAEEEGIDWYEIWPDLVRDKSFED